MEKQKVFVVTTVQHDLNECDGMESYCYGVFTNKDDAIKCVNQAIADFQGATEDCEHEFELEKGYGDI